MSAMSPTELVIEWTACPRCEFVTGCKYSVPWHEGKGFGSRSQRRRDRRNINFREPPQWDRPRSERPRQSRADRKRLRARRRKRERTASDER